LDVANDRNKLGEPPEKLGKNRWPHGSSNGLPHRAPDKFSSHTLKEQVGNTFMFIAELATWTSYPVALQKIVFNSNRILPYEPQPYLDFKRNFTFSQMSGGSIQTTATQVFVDCKFTIL
jgi:hypothetical protein